MCELKDVHGRRDPSSDEPGVFSQAEQCRECESAGKDVCSTHARTPGEWRQLVKASASAQGLRLAGPSPVGV